MTRFLPALALAAFTLLASSCVFLDGSFHNSELNSFGFSLEANPGLRIAYRAELREASGEILVTIPDYMATTALVPYFTHTGVKVLVGGREQLSGVTAADFSKELVYSVLGRDDATSDYRVVVKIAPPSSDKSLSIIGIGNINPNEDKSCTFHYYFAQSLISNFPYFSASELTRLYFGFFTGGAKVQVGEKSLVPVEPGKGYSDSYFSPYSPANILDFSSPLDIVVTAEDGSQAIYTAKITNKPTMDSFRFKASGNPGLRVDCAGSIDAATGLIEVELPYDADPNSLVAEFWYSGRMVGIGNVSQVSGTSANDFSAEVVYTVFGYGGNDSAYRVRARVAPPKADKGILSIKIGSVKVYADGTFGWYRYTQELAHVFSKASDPDLSLSHLYVLPVIAGRSISVLDGGAARELRIDEGTAKAYPSNFVDFSSPVTFVVKAEDGTTASYAAHIAKE